MIKILKTFSIIFLFSMLLTACKSATTTTGHDDHEHVSVWNHSKAETVKCGEYYEAESHCEICNKVLEQKNYRRDHEHYQDYSKKVCEGDYICYVKCYHCNYIKEVNQKGLGHIFKDWEIIREATSNLFGIKRRECIEGDKTEEVDFAANSYSYHGKLSVAGPDLVDEHNEKFQIIGISTHGLQWFGRYVTYESFEAIKTEFGINAIRLAVYTAENGICTGNEERKKYMYNTAVKGIEIATALDLYVIVDWHMVGADLTADKNPLTFVNEAKEFFGSISKQFKDNDNIIYEIMNEPNGATTWNDCKSYAEEVIPEIRKNTDAVVLVGNPRWSADLNSVMSSPLTGFDNIMYTYHFYAGDHKTTTQVSTAYDRGFPVFISEHGGMNSDGAGDINYSSVKNWYSVLDTRNISYVAWCIANSASSSSLLKTTNLDITDFSDNGLKVWGRWYKIKTRTKAGLPVYGSVDENTEKK